MSLVGIKLYTSAYFKVFSISGDKYLSSIKCRNQLINFIKTMHCMRFHEFHYNFAYKAMRFTFYIEKLLTLCAAIGSVRNAFMFYQAHWILLHFREQRLSMRSIFHENNFAIVVYLKAIQHWVSNFADGRYKIFGNSIFNFAIDYLFI